MAARFWVGGTGSLDGFDTAHISATSGGAGGASYPVAGDTLTFNSASGGGTVTFTAPLSVTTLATGAFTGTIDTNGQTVTVSGTFSVSGTGTRTLTLGASTITCGAWDASTTTNLTFNRGTSHIIAVGFTLGGLTYWDVTLNISGLTYMSGTNTFNTLTVNNSGANHTAEISLQASQTASALVSNGYTAQYRMSWRSVLRGTPETLNVSGSVSGSSCDFTDITAAGAASWDLSAMSGGSGDGGGNTGITFSPPLTLYWYADSGNASDAAKWFLGTGGTGGAGRVPISQDVLIFDQNSMSMAGQSVSIDLRRIGPMDWSNVTNSPQMAHPLSVYIHGAVELAAGMTVVSTGGATLSFSTRSAVSYRSNGVSVPLNIGIESPGGTLTFEDHAITTANISHQRGTIIAIGDVTCAAVVSNTGYTRALQMGTGTWTLTGAGTPWNVGSAGLTITPETSTIKLTGVLTAARTFAGAGLTYYNFWNATTGAFAVQFTGSNTFNEVRHDSGRTWRNTAGTTQSFASLIADGVTIGSITAASHTLSKTGGGIVDIDAATISRSTATPGSTFYATGASVDGGNNSGWTFGAPPITTDATAAYASWVAPAATARLRLTTQATAAVSTWTAPAATARTRYTVQASAALSTWVAPSASAQLNRRRSISVPCSVASYSIPTSSTSYQIEVS